MTLKAEWEEQGRPGDFKQFQDARTAEMAFDFPAVDECGMILDESSVNWIGSCDLADVPRVRQQSLCISRRQVRGAYLL